MIPMNCAVGARGTVREERLEFWTNLETLKKSLSRRDFPRQKHEWNYFYFSEHELRVSTACKRESVRHEKALDSEWEGTEHDKRKEEKDMTNIKQKEKKK